jgi:hypothetical protein
LKTESGDAIPIADSRKPMQASGRLDLALVALGMDYRLAEPVPPKAMLEACEASFHSRWGKRTE